MKMRRWQTAVATVLLALGLVALAALLLQPGLTPYLAVDELLAQSDAFRDRPMRLAGYVVGDVQRKVNGLALFRVEARGRSVLVLCSDTVPASLAAGSEVLLDGQLGDDGTFHAHRLLTQCASRYQKKLREPPVGP